MKLFEALFKIHTEIPQLIAITGGGGKTTSMKTLIHEIFLDSNFFHKRILLTTTTKMYPPLLTDFSFACDVIIGQKQLENYINEQNSHSYENPEVIFSGNSIDPFSGKVIGYPADVIDYWIKKKYFDVIICESDGSRSLPIKFYNDDEPVVPVSTSVRLIITGASAIGKPLDSNSIHRFSLSGFSREANYNSKKNLHEKQIITLKDLYSMLLHPLGPLKQLPELQCKTVLYLNQLDLLNSQQIRELQTFFRIHTLPVNAIIFGSLFDSNPVWDYVLQEITVNEGNEHGNI